MTLVISGLLLVVCLLGASKPFLAAEMTLHPLASAAMPEPDTQSTQGDIYDEGKFVFIPIIMGGGSAAPPPSPGPTPSPQPQIGIWLSNEEIAKLPTSGKAWEYLKETADSNWGTADISDQDNKHAVMTLAGALVYARTGEAAYREKVHEAIMAAIGTEDGGRTLALGRSLAAYVIAADLISLGTYYPADDQKFRQWLSGVRTDNIGGQGRWYALTQTHENTANNWGTFAGASRIAASLYLGDTEDVARAALVFQAWLGDRDKYPPNAPGKNGYFEKTADETTWPCSWTNWLAVNPSCSRDGIDLDGALIEDISRGGELAMPPDSSGITYSWEALQGVFVQAELLYRAGYDSYNWSNQALRRALEFLLRAGWDISSPGKHVPWLANARYGTNFPTTEAGIGRIMGYTDWMYGSGK